MNEASLNIQQPCRNSWSYWHICKSINMANTNFNRNAPGLPVAFEVVLMNLVWLSHASCFSSCGCGRITSSISDGTLDPWATKLPVGSWSPSGLLSADEKLESVCDISIGGEPSSEAVLPLCIRDISPCVCFFTRWARLNACCLSPSSTFCAIDDGLTDCRMRARTRSWCASYSSRHGYILEISASKFGSGRSDRFDTSFFRHVGHSLLPLRSAVIMHSWQNLLHHNYTQRHHLSTVHAHDHKDRCHTCDFIMRFCRTTLSCNKVAASKCACRTLQLCRINKYWPSWLVSSCS